MSDYDIYHLSQRGDPLRVRATVGETVEEPMATPHWEQVKTIYCQRAKGQAVLEVEVMIPAEPFPDWPRRVIAHRCSLANECEVRGVGNCCWTGANPLNDPFERI